MDAGVCVRDSSGNPFLWGAAPAEPHKKDCNGLPDPCGHAHFYYFNLWRYMLMTLSKPRYRASQISAWPMETSSKLGMFCLK